MKASNLIFKSCLAFVLGVLLGTKLDFSPLLALFFLLVFCVVFFFSVLFEKKEALLCVLFVVPFGLGIMRIDRAQALTRRPDLSSYFGKKVETRVRVASEPQVTTYKKRFQIFIPPLKAKALVTAPLYPPLHLGDEFLFRGKLKAPQKGPDFDYRAYLERKEVYFLASYPQIRKVEKGKGFSFKKAAVSAREVLEKELERASSFPQAGFFKALLFGSEEGIPPSWKQKLNRTGARHIVAISGANITILSGIVMNFLLGLGLWRSQAIWLAMGFILVYVFMIGCPASGVRAGIMAGFLLLAQKTGRVPESKRLAGFTLFLMLLFSPLLVFDIGFQLSFLAFLGLVYLSPPLSKALKKVPSFLGARENLASTLGAQGLVLPLLLFNFGRLSLVSPLTNILILPALPFLTISAFVFSAASFLSHFLASLLYILPHFLLTLLMKVVDVCSRLPGASVRISLPGWGLALSYFLIAGALVYCEERSSPLS